MGNAIAEPKKKKLTIHDLEVKVGEYKTIQEGDPEMKEDPEFPLHMMYDAMDNNNTIEGNAVQGTYVYYPNKDKPKMWIGNYKILNPEDILCKDVAAKIGMSETQWRKYIEQKKNGKSVSGEYTDFDFLPEDQKETLNNAIKNGLFEYPFDQNNNENQINELGFNENMQKYLNLYNNDVLHLNSANEEQTADLNTVGIEENEPQNNSTYAYEDYTGDIKDIEDYNSYIEKLNAESSRIRHQQEQDIFQQQKKILYYSNMNLDQEATIIGELDPTMSHNVMSPFGFSREEIYYAEDAEEAQMDEQNELAYVENKSPESLYKKEQKTPPKKQIAYLTSSGTEQKIPHEKKEKEKEKEKESEKERGREEPIKAKVNSFRKKNYSNNKVEIATGKNRSKYLKSMTSMSTKSSLGMNKSKIVALDRSKILKNTTLKKN